ncbi:MAG: AAA family ATPase [Rhodocyclaceae bacterium]|nr:AAA family ATPase [Rhodocyclaceae bacterium]
MMNGDEIERARAALLALDAGADRESWVRAAMAAKAAGLDFEDFHGWSAGAGNYQGEADCHAVWKSIDAAGGIKAGTLFAMAREAGWRGDTPVPLHKPHRRARAQEATGRSGFDVDAVWKAAGPADAAHPYIVRKAGNPAGLRVYRGAATLAGQALDGALMVPAWKLDGTLSTAQFIPAGKGKKLNAPGRPVAGAFMVGKLAPPGEGQTIFVCEGIGQAWACHQVTGEAAVVTFGAGRMEAVAREFADRYPAARTVFVADAGKESHCASAAKALRAAWVEMPPGSPPNYDANDLMHERGADALMALLAHPKCPPERFPLLTAAELAAMPPVRWAIKHVLPLKGIAAIYGPSGCGKTFVILDAAMAVSAGLPWFGHRTLPLPVVYVGLEGAAGLASRVQAYRAEHGADAGERVRFITAPLRILETGDLDALAEAIEAAGAARGIAIIDTLNASAPGADENASEDMGRIIDGAKRLQAAIGGVVVLVHHTGKDSTRGLRGHSSLFAALDAAIEVQRDGDARSWKLAKSKDGADGEFVPFRLRVVELGEDDDGEPVTSCVVEPVEDEAAMVKRALPPKAGNQRLIWEGLKDMLKAAGEVRPEGAPKELPMCRPAVRLDDAIGKLRTGLLCEEKRQTERTRQALTGLVARGLVIMKEGFLWLP